MVILLHARPGKSFNARAKTPWIAGAALAALVLSASAAEVKVPKPGTYNLTDNITLQVTSYKDPDGLVRNELTVRATDPEGKKIEDHCGVTFGEQTWGIFAKGGTGGALITIADHWSVQTYQFYTDAKRARFGKAGFDNEARWSMHTKDLLAGRHLAQFSKPDVVAWAKALLPKLKKPPAAAIGPKLEVRLIAEKEREVTMVRPTVARSTVNFRRLGRFVKLGERLLEEKELIEVGAGTGGVLRILYGIRNEESSKRYLQLCRKYKGRKAAFVKDGQVVQQFTLDPNPKTHGFSSIL